MRKIEVLYDVVSPYSYFAFTTLHRYSLRRGVQVTFKPFFLGGVMQAVGNKPPATVPKKGLYMSHDINRCATYFQTGPLKTPSVYVSSAQQLLMTKISHKYSTCAKIIDCNYQFMPTTTSGGGAQIVGAVLAEKSRHQPKRWPANSSLVEVLSTALTECQIPEQDREALFNLANEEKVKSQLKETTDNAVARGAFGAPTMFIHPADKEEMFFGSDRFHILFPMIGVDWEGPNPQSNKL